MYLVNKRLFDIAGKLEVIRNEHVKIFYKNLADLFMKNSFSARFLSSVETFCLPRA